VQVYVSGELCASLYLDVFSLIISIAHILTLHHIPTIKTLCYFFCLSPFLVNQSPSHLIPRRHSVVFILRSPHTNLIIQNSQNQQNYRGQYHGCAEAIRAGGELGLEGHGLRENGESVSLFVLFLCLFVCLFVCVLICLSYLRKY
jgi:hypothetical protein